MGARNQGWERRLTVKGHWETFGDDRYILCHGYSCGYMTTHVTKLIHLKLVNFHFMQNNNGDLKILRRQVLQRTIFLFSSVTALSSELS